MFLTKTHCVYPLGLTNVLMHFLLHKAKQSESLNFLKPAMFTSDSGLLPRLLLVQCQLCQGTNSQSVFYGLHGLHTCFSTLCSQQECVSHHLSGKEKTHKPNTKTCGNIKETADGCRRTTTVHFRLSSACRHMLKQGPAHQNIGR